MFGPVNIALNFLFSQIFYLLPDKFYKAHLRIRRSALTELFLGEKVTPCTLENTVLGIGFHTVQYYANSLEE
jgi:hypothetical protein